MYICNKSDVRDDFSNNGEAQLELKLHPSYMNSLRRKRLRSEIERIETIERIKNFQTLALLLFPPRYFEILVVEVSSKQVFLAVAVAIQRLRLDAICDRVSTGKHFRADYVGGREHPFATRAKASLLERLEKGGDDIF